MISAISPEHLTKKVFGGMAKMAFWIAKIYLELIKGKIKTHKNRRTGLKPPPEIWGWDLGWIWVL